MSWRRLSRTGRGRGPQGQERLETRPERKGTWLATGALPDNLIVTLVFKGLKNLTNALASSSQFGKKLSDDSACFKQLLSMCWTPAKRPRAGAREQPMTRVLGLPFTPNPHRA